MEQVKELALQFFQSATEKTQKALSFVPQDKLTWKPSATAKSALEIATHIAVANGAFADMIKTKASKAANLEEMLAWISTEEAKVTTLEQALALIETTNTAVVDAISSVTDADLTSAIVKTPFGDRPLKRFIFVPEGHTHSHASQIDYLQTIWGDVEMR
jgi:hypothetical protein